jgi:tyrosyl-tRNA synthetase
MNSLTLAPLPLSEQLTARNLINQHSGKSLAEVIDGSKRVVYLGVDPTGDSMHVGHLAALMLLRHVAEAGHKVIFLAGGGTGMIGDPKPNVERTLLPRETIVANVQALKTQAEKILNVQNLTIADNYDWLGSLNLIEFLRDIGKHFTVNNLVKKDAIAARMQSEDGITYTEFSYPLLQSYDFLHLHKEFGCNVQIGGSDQWGNIISGVDLIRRKTGSEVFALTFPLVIDKATGKKFGKSEGNAVWLDGAKTSPFAFYQFWLNTNDESVADFLKIFTTLPLYEIDEALAQHAENKGARAAQRLLASQVTKLVHGESAAQKAQQATDVLFGSAQVGSIDGADVAEFLKDAPHIQVTRGEGATENPLLIDILIQANLASSKREAREFIESGAITLGGVKITDLTYTLGPNDFESNGLQLLKRGKQKVVVLVQK